MNLQRAALFTLFFFGCRFAAAQETPPNVILIMTDDQGYGDFGCQGNEIIQTPHLDAFQAVSTTVSDFYVSPVCSPTRASLMTGRNNVRTQCIDTYLGRSMMATEEITIAESLSEAGYATGIFGKWHLGDCYPMRASDQGFEESLIHRGGGLAQPGDPRDNNDRYTNPILTHNDREVATEGYCADIYFDAASEFLTQAHEEGRPFFAYIASNTPHGPYHDVPEEWREHYLQQDLASLMRPEDAAQQRKVRDLAGIFAMITNIDENVGRLLEQLTALELLENTIVIFITDNGPNTPRYVGPFRGMKSHVLEGGVRSPCWIRWDGHLPAGETVDLLGAHIDLYPTILEACGVAMPEGIYYDGRSMLGPLTGESAADPDRSIVVHGHRGDRPLAYQNFMIRRGPWKLVNPSGFREPNPEAGPHFELYQIENDPGESNDLSEEHPEIVAELREEYDRWFTSAMAEFDAREFPLPIVVDADHEPVCVLTWQDWFGGTWNIRHPGAWSLQFAETGRYDVQLEMPPGETARGPGWTARLQIGDQEWTCPMPEGVEIITFDALNLPAGPAILSAVLEQEGETTRGFYHVRLVRR